MTIRTLAATLGGAALLATSAAPAMAQTASAGTHHKRQAPNTATRTYTDAQLTTVAAALGVTLDDLTAARASVKAAIAATSTRETPAQVNALLATELGGDVTADDVRAAFASLASSTTPSTGTTTGTSDYPSDSGSGNGGQRGAGGGCSHGGSAAGSYPSDSSGSYPSDSSAQSS